MISSDESEPEPSRAEKRAKNKASNLEQHNRTKIKKAEKVAEKRILVAEDQIKFAKYLEPLAYYFENWKEMKLHVLEKYRLTPGQSYETQINSGAFWCKEEMQKDGTMRPGYPPMPHQLHAIEMLTHQNPAENRGILGFLGTGTGKTVLGCLAAENYRRSTLLERQHAERTACELQLPVQLTPEPIRRIFFVTTLSVVSAYQVQITIDEWGLDQRPWFVLSHDTFIRMWLSRNRSKSEELFRDQILILDEAHKFVNIGRARPVKRDEAAVAEIRRRRRAGDDVLMTVKGKSKGPTGFKVPAIPLGWTKADVMWEAASVFRKVIALTATPIYNKISDVLPLLEGVIVPKSPKWERLQDRIANLNGETGNVEKKYRDMFRDAMREILVSQKISELGSIIQYAETERGEKIIRRQEPRAMPRSIRFYETVPFTRGRTMQYIALQTIMESRIPAVRYLKWNVQPDENSSAASDAKKLEQRIRQRLKSRAKQMIAAGEIISEEELRKEIEEDLKEEDPEAESGQVNAFQSLLRPMCLGESKGARIVEFIHDELREYDEELKAWEKEPVGTSGKLQVPVKPKFAIFVEFKGKETDSARILSLFSLRTYLGTRLPELPVVTVHGGMDTYERRSASDRFNNGPARIVIFTRAGAEGIDYKRIRVLFLLQPVWSVGLMKQIQGRAVRLGAMPEWAKCVKLITLATTKANLTEQELEQATDISGDFVRSMFATVLAETVDFNSDKFQRIIAEYDEQVGYGVSSGSIRRRLREGDVGDTFDTADMDLRNVLQKKHNQSVRMDPVFEEIGMRNRMAFVTPFDPVTMVNMFLVDTQRKEIAKENRSLCALPKRKNTSLKRRPEAEVGVSLPDEDKVARNREKDPYAIDNFTISAISAFHDVITRNSTKAGVDRWIMAPDVKRWILCKVADAIRIISPLEIRMMMANYTRNRQDIREEGKLRMTAGGKQWKSLYVSLGQDVIAMLTNMLNDSDSYDLREKVELAVSFIQNFDLIPPARPRSKKVQ